MNPIPRLARPPINEVICGFVLNPTTLTTLDFGVYWERRRNDFPKHELHPPILETAGIQLGGMIDARVWLVSSDDEILVQIQRDRFLVNWRRRGEDYPRFSDYENRQGLKRRAIEEFEQFRAFVQERTSRSPELTRLELVKIDLLKRGVDYDGMADLGELLPITQVFESVSLTDPQQLMLRMAEGNEPTATQIAVVMDGNSVRIETRHKFPFSGDLDKDFVHANERVNQVFFGLVKTDRFREEG